VRTAVLDIGTNSTRLLVADVREGKVHELTRDSRVTRLGAGVDRSGRLAEDAMERVLAVLDEYSAAIDAHAAREAAVAILTSAVRDAANGPDFVRMITARYGLDARTLSGDEEARLTFAGATSARDPADRSSTLVIDVGGGSTEMVVGAAGQGAAFHVSTQAGVVRQSERHIASDPPDPRELEALAAEVAALFARAVPEGTRRSAQSAIAVAGTATSLAAIAQELEPYRPDRVDGYVLELGECELLLTRLAGLTDAERRALKGLHPDRAPTIVAGVIILLEALRCFGLERMQVSERDILHGVALARAAAAAAPSPQARFDLRG